MSQLVGNTEGRDSASIFIPQWKQVHDEKYPDIEIPNAVSLPLLAHDGADTGLRLRFRTTHS